MKNKLLFILTLFLFMPGVWAQPWIRVNQLGYLPHSVKVAVFISGEAVKVSSFRVCDAITDEVVFSGKTREYDGSYWGMKSAFRLDFSSLTTPGGYYIIAGKGRSEPFRINADVYRGTADFILNYVRQQRCGYNPFLRDSCHTHDGVIVDHPDRTGEITDVIGGYHDASDHLRYTATTATSVYQMMLAWSRAKGVYADNYNENGLPGANGMPDILDEAKWGLQWLIKMNPDSGVMFNQVADDRDHRGFRLPNEDQATYDLGKYRPVYFVTGKPQGLAKYKNRTEGAASTAAKFSSVFALGSVIMQDYDPALSGMLEEKALDAFEYALTDPGATQTACNVSPYFYEEDNYVDDMELAAWELYNLTGEKKYLEHADYWGSLEPVTPWIEKDTARHYQFYPFVNLGHANMALSSTAFAGKYMDFMRKGLSIIDARDKTDPFLLKIPFIWCSNNYVSAALAQCRLYYEASGDDRFAEMEAALRDWLFGCNPWGTSMICGLPAGGDYPLLPHSAVTKYLGVTTTGGLVDGPVYKSIYEELKGVVLMNEDSYAPFQHGNVVYHDDIGDYSTNEPTLDGTAGLSIYLSALEKEGKEYAADNSDDLFDSQGAMIRHGVNTKDIYLIFSADGFGEGLPHILDVLGDNNIKASFFLTGNFLRNREFKAVTERIIREGHFLGPHSDRHLLYASWEKRDSLLVPEDLFISDIRANYSEIVGAGVKDNGERYFLAPYEWYNQSVSSWASSLGLTLINFTPGTGTNADYTTPGMSGYRSSEQLIERLKKFEENDPDGLSGAFLLIHPGTDPSRTDKLWIRLEEIINYYSERGYTFKRL